MAEVGRVSGDDGLEPRDGASFAFDGFVGRGALVGVGSDGFAGGKLFMPCYNSGSCYIFFARQDSAKGTAAPPAAADATLLRSVSATICRRPRRARRARPPPHITRASARAANGARPTGPTRALALALHSWHL